MYDNETGGGILAEFDDASKQIAKVKSDVEALHKNYNQLMGMYDTFTDYNDTMNGIINTMSNNVGNIEKSFNTILTSCQQVITENIATDNTLMDDLEGINSLLSRGSVDGNGNYGTGASTLDSYAYQQRSKKDGSNGYPTTEAGWNDTQKSKGKITGDDPTASGTSYNMSADYSKVADEIIQGKYGNGPERFAELEKQGYDSRTLQNIVNDKLNNTFDPNNNEYYNYLKDYKTNQGYGTIADFRYSQNNETNSTSGTGGYSHTLDDFYYQTRNKTSEEYPTAEAAYRYSQKQASKTNLSNYNYTPVDGKGVYSKNQGWSMSTEGTDLAENVNSNDYKNYINKIIARRDTSSSNTAVASTPAKTTTTTDKTAGYRDSSAPSTSTPNDKPPRPPKDGSGPQPILTQEQQELLDKFGGQ